MFFDRKPEPAAAQPDLAHLKVTDAKIGDTLSVVGAADDFSDLDFTIDRMDAYSLSGTWRDRRVYLEVRNRETIEVLGNFDGRRLSIDELGLSEQDLADLDQRQNPADFFDFENKFWLYRQSRDTGRGFYGWEFQEQDGKRYLSVRKSAGEPFTASIWIRVEPSDITVFRGA